MGYVQPDQATDGSIRYNLVNGSNLLASLGLDSGASQPVKLRTPVLPDGDPAFQIIAPDGTILFEVANSDAGGIVLHFNTDDAPQISVEDAPLSGILAVEGDSAATPTISVLINNDFNLEMREVGGNKENEFQGPLTVPSLITNTAGSAAAPVVSREGDSGFYFPEGGIGLSCDGTISALFSRTEASIGFNGAVALHLTETETILSLGLIDVFEANVADTILRAPTGIPSLTINNDSIYFNTDGNTVMSIDGPVFGLLTQTSNAGAAVGTLLNAPAAGNPDYWLRIDINNVPHAVPAWELP
jgi:hypothetical protein